MARHLMRELDKLKRQLLSLSALVEENQRRAVRAIETLDEGIAREVIDLDDAIDNREVEVEEECLKIFALHQPVAVDLRFLVAVLKINNDLERIGDLAVNMAERAILLAQMGLPEVPVDFTGMADVVGGMVRDSLDALVTFDENLARKVCCTDAHVDEMNREIYERIKQAIVSSPEDINALIHLLSASRHLERTADHATNIAEDVIYMVTGDVVRHRHGIAGQPGAD